MKPIYAPTGRAEEYADYAINIYTGCNHGCIYCYAAKAAHRWGKDFTHVEPRNDIVQAVKRQLEHDKFKGELINLCFQCDPYPAEIDTTATREVIKAIKDSGNHVQILTKGGKRAERDFDLLDKGDWFGITLAGDCEQAKRNEPNAAPNMDRLKTLYHAHERGITTWVSFEPVYSEGEVYDAIKNCEVIDHYKIGKLNHCPSNINWADFGRKCECLCQQHGRNYQLKEDLRKEMEG